MIHMSLNSRITQVHVDAIPHEIDEHFRARARKYFVHDRQRQRVTVWVDEKERRAKRLYSAKKVRDKSRAVFVKNIHTEVLRIRCERDQVPFKLLCLVFVFFGQNDVQDMSWPRLHECLSRPYGNYG